MARINKNKMISGAIGNIVFRDTGKTQILLSKPNSIRQTKATKAAGSEFRQCSSWATRLRSGLVSFLEKDTDSFMHGRLNGKLYSAIQQNTGTAKGDRTPLNSDMSSMAGFEFNTNSPFADYFIPEINAVLNDQRQVEITVPEFHPGTAITFAKNTRQAELLVYVLVTNFEPHTGFMDAYMIIPIPNNYQKVNETLWTSPEFPEGHLIMVCAKLLYYNTNRFTEKTYVNSKECSPAKVLMVSS